MSVEKMLAIVMGTLFASMFGALALEKYSEYQFMIECTKNHTPTECKTLLK